MSSIFSDAGGYSWSGWRAPVAARYKLRIAGYTIWVAGGGVARWFYEGQGAEKAPVYHTLLWHRPNLDEVYPGRRNEPIGVYAQAGGQTRPIGAVDFTPKPTVSEIEVFLLAERGRADRRLPALPHARQRHGRAVRQSRSRPRTACRATPSSGSRSKARSTTTRPAGRAIERLFDRLRLVPSEQARTGVPLEIGPSPSAGPAPARRRAAGRGDPGAVAVREALYEVESAAPREDAERLLRSFLKKAYRRPVAEADVQRFLRAVRRPVPEGLRLHAVDALGLHGRPGVAGLRVRRGEAGPARRPRPGHAAGPVPVELGPRRHAADAGRPRRAEQAGRAARPDRADARRPQVTPLRRGVHRLLARPAEDRRHVAVHHALQRLRARRPAEAGGAGGDAALLRRTAARRPAGAERRRFGLHVPERAAGRALRHRRRLRRPASAR